MDWGGATTTFSVGIGVVTAFYIFTPTDARTTFVDPTIMRLLVAVSGRNNGAETAIVTHAHFGVIAWDDIDNTVDNVPDPFNWPNLDWMLTGARSFTDNAATFTSEGSSGSGWIESAAKRRMGNQKGLLFVLYSPISASYSVTARYLLKS